MNRREPLGGPVVAGSPSVALGQIDPATLLHDAPDAMLLVDEEGVIRYANAQAEALFGHPLKELLGSSVEQLLPVQARKAHRSHRLAYLAAPSVRPMGAALDLRASRADGSTFPVEISLSPLALDDGRLTLAGVRDVSRQREAERALRLSEETFRRTVASSPVGIGLLRADGTWRSVNPALCALAGRSEAELLDTTLFDVVRDAPPDLSPATRLQRELQRPDGTTAWVEMTLTALPDESGPVVVHLYDVTDQYSHQQQLQALALSDPLTGLPNRTLLLDRTRQTLRNLARHPGRCALLLLDLDHFKTVNDTLGHLAGDELLRQVAQRFSSVARASDTVARLGGDEFALLCPEVPTDALAFAARLLRCLDDDVVLRLEDGSTRTARIGASIGIAVSDDPQCSAADLYRDADVALYASKAGGRGIATLFDPGMRHDLDRRVAEESRLRHALMHGGVRVLLQPIVDLASQEVTAYEALARLEVPGEPDLVEPAQFLPVAFERGLVSALDEEVLRLCLAELDRTPGPPLHLNVSVPTLEAGQWQQTLLAALDADPQLTSRLHVELTEQALLSASSAAEGALVELRRRGFRIGLDDFGTGYSSLSNLERLQVDFLKLDTTLVARLVGSGRAQVLTRGLIALATELGLQVVAEGIEEEAAAELLTRWGCDRGQGYLFGRPASTRHRTRIRSRHAPGGAHARPSRPC